MSEQPSSTSGGGGGGVERKGGGGVGDALKVMFRTKRNSVVRRSSSSSIRSNSNNNINSSISSSSIQDSWRTNRTYSGDDRNFSYSVQQQQQQNQKKLLESKKKSEINSSITSVGSSSVSNNNIQQQHQHHWDLKTCIETIESLLENDTTRTALSEDQKAAIGNLRTISTSSQSRQSKRLSRSKLDSLLKRLSGGKHGTFSIQSPFFSSTTSNTVATNNLLSSRQKSIFMTEEMRENWIEVSNDNNDTDRQQCVHDVLEHFGGTHYDPVWGGNINDVVPMTLRKMTYGKSVRRSGVGHAGMSTLLTEFKDGGSKELVPPHSSSSVSFSPSLDIIGSGDGTEISKRRQLKINYCPPEWNRLTIDAKTELTQLLSLENLSRWDFDVFKVADLTRVTLLTTSSSNSMREECDEEEHKEQGVCEEEGGEEEEKHRQQQEQQQQSGDGNCINTKIEQFCPLLFIGWAILCAPMAQHSMEGSLEGYASTRDPSYYRLGTENNDDDNDDDININSSSSNNNNNNNNFHYHFDDHLKINPESICNFLREIEKRYSATTPYHNNTHAADVTQTLHCLLASIGKDLLYSISKPFEIFSLILAATFHDVGHPGTNNLFHKNAMTSLALQFNDVSILENMHSAVGHSLLMGDEKRDEWDVFKGWDRSQIVSARGIMIRAILGTDMSNHFFKMDELMEKIESVRFTANIVLQSELGEDEMEGGEGGGAGGETKMRSRDEKDQQLLLDMLANTQPDTRRLSREEGKFQQHQILELLAKMRAMPIPTDKETSKTYAELKAECVGLSSQILVFLLHAADISNPTKPQKICVRWAHNALNEFFAQGEKEKELSLPVSPLCDKQTTKTADSQIGFLQFVVRPAYVLLGDIVPRVKEELLPIIDENLEYWKTMKRRESFQKKQEQLK